MTTLHDHPVLTALDAEWRTRAACRDNSGEAFFPIGNPDWTSERDLDRAETAKQICRSCPAAVRAACLADALQAEDRWAIRGGTTPPERRGRR